MISQPLPPVPDISVQKTQDSVLFYIAGYVAYKLKEKVCNTCTENLQGNLCGAEHEMFLKAKMIEEAQKGLCVPSQQLFTVIKNLEVIFNANTQYLLHMDKVVARMMHHFSKHEMPIICQQGSNPCKVQKLIQSVYLNIRLHFVLKEHKGICNSIMSSKQETYESQPFLKCFLSLLCLATHNVSYIVVLISILIFIEDLCTHENISTFYSCY